MRTARMRGVQYRYMSCSGGKKVWGLVGWGETRRWSAKAERAHRRPSCAMVTPGPPWVFFLLFPSAGGRELTEEEEEEDYAVIIAAWIKAAECTLVKRGGAIRRIWEVEGRVIFGLERTFSLLVNEKEKIIQRTKLL